MTMNRIIKPNLLALLLLLHAGAAAAQESDVFSGAEWLTKDQLRSCLLLDYELVGHQPLVDNLRREQQAAAAAYMAAYDARSGEEEALERFQQADAVYGDAQARQRAMLEEFAADCSDRPYSLLHFNQLRDELGFGWSSPQ